LNPPDTNIPPNQQKYKRIKNLVLYVDSGLDNVTPEEISGEAVVNSGFLPNVNDVFVADLANGRRCMMVITDVAARHYNLHDVFNITYSFFAFADTSVELFNNVEYKTIVRYNYNADFISLGGSPLILEEEYEKKIDLSHHYKRLMRNYLSDFLDKDSGYLLVPADKLKIVDPYITRFILSIVDVNDVSDYTRITSLDFSGYESVTTIWNVILERDITMLSEIDTINLINPATTFISYFKRNIGYTGLDYVYYKKTFSDVNQVTFLDQNRGDVKLSTIVPNTSGRVFSDYFYKGDLHNCTDFEIMLYGFLNGDYVSLEKIDALLSDYSGWSDYKRFYLTPILVIFMKEAYNKIWFRG
jgi:hypothetical protein